MLCIHVKPEALREIMRQKSLLNGLFFVGLYSFPGQLNYKVYSILCSRLHFQILPWP